MKQTKPKSVKIKISKKLQKKIRSGYPWIFYYQIQNRNIPGELGDIGLEIEAQPEGIRSEGGWFRGRIFQEGRKFLEGRVLPGVAALRDG